MLPSHARRKTMTPEPTNLPAQAKAPENLLQIIQEIEDFQLICENEEYMDTGEAYNLLSWIVGELRKHSTQRHTI
jgi:hypothetical protein